jgi:CubicO group peptidase (beta-lactamase class C family)
MNLARQKVSLPTFIICLFTVFTLQTLRAQPAMQAVKKNIQQRLNEGNILGISIAYINPDGNVIYYFDGFLSADDKHRVNKNTIFEIGSVTKSFTSLTLARMAIQQKILLNDPTNKFLSDSIQIPSYHGKKITLEELATHTSGLPRMPANFSPQNPLDPYIDYTVHDLYEFLDHYKLIKAPETSYQYSNLGVGLLGTILANVAGKSYSRLVQECITNPLGMNDTGVKVPKSEQNRFAVPYNYGNKVRH